MTTLYPHHRKSSFACVGDLSRRHSAWLLVFGNVIDLKMKVGMSVRLRMYMCMFSVHEITESLPQVSCTSFVGLVTDKHSCFADKDAGLTLGRD